MIEFILGMFLGTLITIIVIAAYDETEEELEELKEAIKELEGALQLVENLINSAIDRQSEKNF